MKRILKMLLPGYSLDQKIYNNYLIAHFFYKKGIKFFAHLFSHRIYRKYHCVISYKAKIGKNVKFPHPLGIVIGENVSIGDNCIIYQNVTLGRKNKDKAEYPVIKNNVTIYANAVIAGKIIVGDNSIIGCNAVVLKSVAPNSKCIGVVK